jgi:hypothetical protein
MKKEQLDEIRNLWEKEDDKWLIKALCRDSSEYPEEVICVIKEIAEKRNLIKSGSGRNDAAVLTMELCEAGADIKSDLDEKVFNRKPSTLIHRLIKVSFIVINILLCAMSYVMEPVERQIRLEKERKTGIITWCCFGMGIFVSILLICACVIELNEIGDGLSGNLFELSVMLYFFTVVIGIISLVANARKKTSMNTNNVLLATIGLAAGPVTFVGLIIFVLVYSIATGSFMGNAR